MDYWFIWESQRRFIRVGDACPSGGGKRPNRNLGRYGQLGMKDSQFPVNQEIQGPVLHAFTMDRKFYEDCTYWNPFWGSTPGLPTSNIHDLGKWGPILGTGRLISPAHFQEQIAPTSVGKGRNRPDLYFAYGFVVANGWIAQNLSINGYSGGFGYHLATGVTIVVEATKSEAHLIRKRLSEQAPQSRSVLQQLGDGDRFRRVWKANMHRPARYTVPTSSVSLAGQPEGHSRGTNEQGLNCASAQ